MQMRQAVVAYSPPKWLQQRLRRFLRLQTSLLFPSCESLEKSDLWFCENFVYNIYQIKSRPTFTLFLFSIPLFYTFCKWILVIICLHSFLYKLSHTTIFLRLGATLELTRVIYRNNTNQSTAATVSYKTNPFILCVV